MSEHNIAAVILAAGRGTRMCSNQPKVLHKIAGRTLIAHVLEYVESLSPKHTVVVLGPKMDDVKSAVAPCEVVVQQSQKGTADAVKAAREVVEKVVSGTVFIFFGDTPLIRVETLKLMLELRRARTAVVVLGFHPDNPSGYGRLKQDTDGNLVKIIEEVDLKEAEKEITLCNSGVMAVDAACLMELVDAVHNENRKKEFYLTDIVGIAQNRHLSCDIVVASAEELAGVNSRLDLAAVEASWQEKRRARAMGEGATLLDPKSVWFSYDTRIGRDVVIGPNVQFGTGVTLGDRVEVKAFCHLEGSHIKDDAVIGPFARLRPGSEIGRGSRIGNFVEIKNAVLGEGTRVGHLAYLGDALVGTGANIGAGTITCNYDGIDKHQTIIGEGTFIGTNTSLVAPVLVGNGAFVAAGSVITDDVSADSLAIARTRQIEKTKRASQMRGKSRVNSNKISNIKATKPKSLKSAGTKQEEAD